MERDLWLPKNAPSLRALRLDSVRMDDGTAVDMYGFTYKCKCSNEQYVRVVMPGTASDAQIEDSLATAFASVLKGEGEAHQRAAMTLTPNDVSTWSKSLKLDVAEELRHVQRWLKRRKWSRQTLWKGV